MRIASGPGQDTVSGRTGRLTTCIVATTLSVWAACLLVITSPAWAHRAATQTESEGMWRVVDIRYGYEGCVQRRGLISTAHTLKLEYGSVVVSDDICGNGQYVLARPRHVTGARWRVLGAGSDWGDPERCSSDLRHIPRKVLQDFFGPGTCAPRMAGAGI